MTPNDLFNPIYIKAVARSLAKVNCLDVPINKKSNWLIDNLNRFKHKIKQEFKIEQVNQNQQEIANQLANIDFGSEIEWIKKHVINKVKSPIVFCNNDVFSLNILIRDEILNKINKLNAKEDCQQIDKLIDDLAVIIDFEFCAYNFRGSEIGLYFWSHKMELNETYFGVDRNNYPDEQHQRLFIREYLNKLKQIKGNLDDEIDNEDHLLKEVEAYQIGFLWYLILIRIDYAINSKSNHSGNFDFWVS